VDAFPRPAVRVPGQVVQRAGVLRKIPGKVASGQSLACATCAMWRGVILIRIAPRILW
jgi:hypothetical protein